MKVDAWDKAEVIDASQSVTDIAQCIEGGPVQARFDREGNQVLLRFNALKPSTRLSPITEQIQKAVGPRYEAMVQELSDNGWLMVKLPVQAYMDKLDGVDAHVERGM